MSRKIQQEIYRNGKRASSTCMRTLIKHGFLLYYLCELLMIFEFLVKYYHLYTKKYYLGLISKNLKPVLNKFSIVFSTTHTTSILKIATPIQGTLLS